MRSRARNVSAMQIADLDITRLYYRAPF